MDTNKTKTAAALNAVRLANETAPTFTALCLAPPKGTRIDERGLPARQSDLALDGTRWGARPNCSKCHGNDHKAPRCKWLGKKIPW